MHLVLFDIDGTLLRSQGIGGRAMERAGRRVIGPSFSLAGIEFGGALDRWIYGQAVTRMGRTDGDELHAEFHEAYLAELAFALEAGVDVPLIIPGVDAALRAASARTTTTLGLVTGNYSRAAPLKLRAAGIDPSQFVVGAFGGDAPTRPDLVRLAIEQWRARGADADPCRVVVIGDTPRDVDCAHKNGCRSIAVATGWHTMEQLAKTGADRVVGDLSDLSALLDDLWNV